MAGVVQLKKQIRLTPNLGSIRNDGRAGRLVSRIRKICRIASSGFHPYFIAKLGERSSLALSGEIATRFSPGSISLGMLAFIWKTPTNGESRGWQEKLLAWIKFLIL